MKSGFQVLLTSLLCISLATAGSRAQAEMLRGDSDAATERDRVVATLQRPDIRARLAAQGVDVAEVEARLAALTDEEATLLASKFEDLPAGGNDPRGLLGVLVAAAIVYVVIKLLPFILIGGGTFAAIKAAQNSPSGQSQAQPGTGS
jgi:hypothetical protein